MLPSVDAQVGAATVNRKLSSVSSFYQQQARHGVDVGELLVVWRPGGRGGWKPLLHHISKDLPQRQRAISLRTPRKLPRVLTAVETQAIRDACGRPREFACGSLGFGGAERAAGAQSWGPSSRERRL